MDNKIHSRKRQGTTNALEVINLRSLQEIPGFKLYSWRLLYTAIIAILQTLAAGVCLYKLFVSAITIRSLVELILYCIWKISAVLECNVLDDTTFEKIVNNMYPAFSDIGIAYNIPTAILLQNYLPPSTWGTLREDYNRATRLIRRFDDVFGGLVLLSFATNLFWICLQIFNILGNGMRPTLNSFEMCPHHRRWLFNGYEHPIFTTSVLITRFTTMCLSAASVNVASMVPASALYRVTSCSYSIEVQRFLDQVHDDVVALTGMKYFHINRELVLSMAGTILTYELVLLQLGGEEF
ncbi:unnamed protein product [Arctia plantaginis]|uniref:Gustatory receptor n=1 Tax=Arctia plantaginis TaxID=874455 RepID=A0A8S1AGE5_ARCPL|nr:unnamed protein product [Arctia plantaginis]